MDSTARKRDARLLLALLLPLAACGGGASSDDGGGWCADDSTPPRLLGPAEVLVYRGEAQNCTLTFSEIVGPLDSTTVTLEQTRGESGAGSLWFDGGLDGDTVTVGFSAEHWEQSDRFALHISPSVADRCGRRLDDEIVIPVALSPEAGMDVDQRGALSWPSGYDIPPPEFYTALDRLGLSPADLSYPDAGATYRLIPTRLHWTDTLRHQGDTGPLFAKMAAEDVLAALDSPGGERLGDVLVAAHTYQAREEFRTLRYDRAYRTEDRERPLLAALQAFYEHAPVEGSTWTAPRPWTEVEADLAGPVAGLPLRVQADLALAVRALLDAADLRNEALASSGVLPMDNWRTIFDHYRDGASGYSTYTHLFGTTAHPSFDFDAMARAGELTLRAVETLRSMLAGEPAHDGRVELVGSLGRIAIDLDGEADEWQGDDYFLLVDGGGDDTYLDSIAVNGTFDIPISVVLDLAGNDTYRPSTPFDVAATARVPMQPSCTQGAGLFGVAVLDDARGNDDYFASRVAQGVGVFGVGVLADHGGTDRYRAYILSQGAADFGWGLLVDLGPDDDSYETLQTSQGYGGPRGIGWLVEEGGDDDYVALSEPIVWDWAGEGANWSGSQGFGYGVRDGFFTEGAPIFSGGLGGLFDLDGNDDYSCSVMCQGFGYAFGTGLFYDRRGDDTHLVTHKYALGSATHWAVGLYLDEDGADTYRNSGDDECIGLGYDASVAFHIDRGDGNDTYTLDNAGQFVLGVSRIPALGVLINEGGDDEYHVPGDGSMALGRTYTVAGNRTGYLASVPSVGMFFDLGGTTDLYDTPRADLGNGLEWIQTEPLGDDWAPATDFGYGLDAF